MPTKTKPKPIGRPAGSGDHDALVHLRINNEILRDVDAECGKVRTGVTRSHMIRTLIEEALTARRQATR